MNSRRYYTAQTAGIPLVEQDELARRDGLKDDGLCYRDIHRSFPRERNKCFDSFRAKARDEHIWVSDFVVIVPKRKYLEPIFKALKKAKAYLYEGRHGRDSRNAKDYAAMLHDASRYWATKRLPHSLAVKFGQMGGEAFAEGRKAVRAKRMPDVQAQKIWRDPRYETADDAVEAMNAAGYKEDWSRTAAYRDLGKRFLLPGPRKPKK